MRFYENPYLHFYCEDCGAQLGGTFYTTPNCTLVCSDCAELYEDDSLTIATMDDVIYEMASHIRNLDDVRDDY